MSASLHPEERLQDEVDGRLSDAAAVEVREHLVACAACRALRAELVAARQAVAMLRTEAAMPADLLASVHRALDAEGTLSAAVTARPSAATRAPGSATRRRRWFAVAAAAAAVVAYLMLGNQTTPLDLPGQVARDLGAVGSRSLPLALPTSDPAVLERYFASSPTGPRVRVIDLGMMRIALEGGARHTLGDTPSALYSYRTPSGQRLVCQMYVGQLGDLPSPEQSLDDHGFRFQVYTRGAVTVVFWQEGDLVCVLASGLPAEEVIALALAKAMAPA